MTPSVNLEAKVLVWVYFARFRFGYTWFGYTCSKAMFG